MSNEVIDRLKEKFGTALESTHHFRGDSTALVAAESWLEVMKYLRDEAGFDQWIDLTATDYLGREEGQPRFEVVVHLRRMKDGDRIRVKARLASDKPAIATLSEVWKGANWMERECREMYGIDFVGSPDQRPLLLYPEFKGFPLRKDYPIDRRQPLIPLLGSEERRFPIPPDTTAHGHQDTKNKS